MSVRVATRPSEAPPDRQTERVPGRAGERWHRTWSGPRLGPFALGILLAGQAACALVVVLALIARPLVVPGLVVLVSIGVLSLVKVKGRPLWRHVRLLRHDANRTRAAAMSPRSEGFPTAEHEDLVPLLHLAPDLTVTRVEGRSGGPAAVACDGRGFTAVLAADRQPMVARSQPLGIGLLADLCDVDGCGFDSGQLLVTVTPARTATAGMVPALVEAYAEVNPTAAPRSVDWLIALRKDPTRPRAGSARGLPGAGMDTPAAIRSAADRATKVLSAAGLHARMLSHDETVRALGAACQADRRRPRPERGRFAESADELAIDGLVHVTAWVRDLGEHPGGLTHLVDLLADLPVQAAVVSLVVTVTGQRRLRVSAYLRLAASTSEVAQSAFTRLTKSAHRAGLGVVPLTNEQAAGLRATVPLGGDAL